MSKWSIESIVGSLGRAMAILIFVLATQNLAAETKPDFISKYLALGFSRKAPALGYFSVDSKGEGSVSWNPVLKQDSLAGSSNLRFEVKSDGEFAYSLNAAGKPSAVWTITCRKDLVILRSHYLSGVDAPPFTITFDQKSNHATLLGLMKAGERRMALPCVLHLPDMGTLRITSEISGLYLDYDARRYVKTPFVYIAFPSAMAEHPIIEYELQVTAIYPDVAGIAGDSRYDGFRRSYLNLFQVNPRVQMLANNASSDPVPFTLYMDAEMAVPAPPLAEGLTCLDLVRMTLDRYIAGAKGYGLVGYGVDPGEADLVSWKAPWNSLDTYPSLLIAAGLYAQGAQDWKWAKANYDTLAAWSRKMWSSDKNGNGLLEHPYSGNSGDRATHERRPSNWWDTIDFGHEDAYSNALAYRAGVLMSEIADKLGRKEDAELFSAKFAKLRTVFKPTFLNPATGVLAGWKSADGQLHDYYFTFVNGIAVAYGLLDQADGNAVMDKLLAKMKEVGFTNFRLGLPGNLIPIKKADYVFHNWKNAREVGEPSLEDGSDAFQLYENGGATACYAYFTIKALYTLGRKDDARRIFYPMLESYARGDFQGFCDNGKSKDWRDWDGGCHGYEGLLTDGYLGLLAVVDDVKVEK